MIRIGLTGGIGSGKSTVADRLKTLGAAVIDADAAARAVTSPGSEGLRRITVEFGRHFAGPNGSLDRSALAAEVFGDSAKREKLENLLHPLIFAHMLAEADSYSSRTAVVFDVPLLFETGFNAQMDVVWVVTANLQTRLVRIMQRDACTREQALRRISAQLDDETKIRRANAVIHNDAGLAELYERTDALWQELKR